MGLKNKFDLKNNKTPDFRLMEAMKFASEYDYIAAEYSIYFDNIINNMNLQPNTGPDLDSISMISGDSSTSKGITLNL